MNTPDTRIRDYNEGRLQGSQLEEFELQMVQQPTLARAVELDALLAAGLSDYPAVELSLSPSARRGWAPLLVAASVGALVMSSGYFLWAARPPTAAAAYGTVRYAELGMLRNLPDAPVTRLKLSASELLVLEIAALDGIAPNQTQTVQITAVNGDRAPLQLSSIADAALLTIGLPSGLLPAGEYRVEVQAGERRGPVYPLIIEK